MKILVVDDEMTSREIIRSILEGDGHEVHLCDDGECALEVFGETFDLVISDYHMPGMSGADIFEAVRARRHDIPFIYITTEDNTTVAVELMRRGASDLVRKPVNRDALRLRIERVTRDARHQREIQRIRDEELLIQLENQKLTNWRMLYVNQDSQRAGQLIGNLSRSINHSGGFGWLDLVRETSEVYDDDRYLIPRSVLDLAIGAAANHKELIDRITEIGMLSAENSPLPKEPVSTVIASIDRYVRERLMPLLSSHGRTLSVGVEGVEGVEGVDGDGGPETADRMAAIPWDRESMNQVLDELAFNAVKYSPSGSQIRFWWGIVENQPESTGPLFVIEIKNQACHAQARDADGEAILGVPYDYRELVFDPFFTIESFPKPLPEEYWRDGTGLTFVRTVCRRLGGWADIATGVERFGSTAEPVVTVSLQIPCSQVEK